MLAVAKVPQLRCSGVSAPQAWRAVGFPDLLIAAVAGRERVTVLHYDSDFDLIARVTGQPVQWVVPRGTVP
jgi:predicted nucleic acid-binding protein